MMPAFWGFLEEQARQQRLTSSEMVLQELQDGEDQLKQWASGLRTVLFRVPTVEVQERYSEVVANVNSNGRYAPHNVSRFLAKADPWLIAHARTDGGRDVGHEFGIICINLYDLIEELGFSV
jgi:predicted DNA-binding ribbon-helix-helix protein